MSDFLPCPFCGGSATIESSYTPDAEGQYRNGCWVECDSCGCEVGRRRGLDSQENDMGAFSNESEAKAKWNTRQVDSPALAGLIGQLELAAEGHEHCQDEWNKAGCQMQDHAMMAAAFRRAADMARQCQAST